MDSDNLTLAYWLLNGWQVYKDNLKRILAAAMVFSICGWFKWWMGHLPYGAFISQIFAAIVGPALMAGFSFFCLMLVREKPARPQDFLAGFLHFGRVWLTNLLLILIVVAGLVLFIVPGIIWGCKYCLGMIIVLDKKLSPVKVIKLSGKVTHGYKAKLLLLSIPAFAFLILQFPLAFILQNPTQDWGYPFVILGLILYLLSNFVVSPWMFVVWATAYDALNKRYEEATK